MKKIAFAGGALIALALANPASGADLKAPVFKAPPPPPAFSWTGCYAGANAGWVGSHDQFNLAPSGNYLAVPFGGAPPNAAGGGAQPADLAAVTNSYTHDASGGEIGPQVGCNWQAGWFVLGGEADIQWSSLNNTVDASYGTIPSVIGGFTIAPHTEHVSSKLEWFSTVRGRIGVPFDRVLLYATGGLAIGGVKSDTAVTFGTAGATGVYNLANQTGSMSATRTGWVVGAGGEYAFAPRWSVKAEYLYIDLGSFTYPSPLVAPAGVAPGYSWSTTVRERDQVVRVGVNYRFGGM